MSRYFFALNPDSQTRKKIREVQNDSELDVRGLVPAANLHLTLLFLGHVEKENYNDLIDITNDIDLPGFTLQIARSGWWKRSRIAWVAPNTASKPLFNLVNSLSEAARQSKIAVANRDFHAHITLARRVRSFQAVGFTPIHWEVTEFCLFNSTSIPGGVEYKLMHAWPLS